MAPSSTNTLTKPKRRRLMYEIDTQALQMNTEEFIETADSMKNKIADAFCGSDTIYLTPGEIGILALTVGYEQDILRRWLLGYKLKEEITELVPEELKKKIREAFSTGTGLSFESQEINCLCHFLSIRTEVMQAAEKDEEDQGE